MSAPTIPTRSANPRSGEARTSSRNQTNTPNLWHEALNSLSYDEQRELEFTRGATHPTPSSVLTTITDKRNDCVKKQWVLYINKNGEKIMVRELFNKISDWIHRFRTIGDVAVQYNAGHAAIPWAAVRFFLQIAVNDCQTFGSMLEGIERVSSIVARYTELEARILTKASAVTKQLSEALIKLYATILRFFARARQYYEQSTLKRILKSSLHSPRDVVEGPVLRIEKDEDEVYRLVCLVHNERTNESFADIIASMKQNQMSPERFAEGQRRRLLDWLKVIDVQTSYETILQYHHAGTCEWAVRLQELQVWLSPQRDNGRSLWIHGPAGFGKTFISAWIVRHLIKNHQGPVAHFFCSADEKYLRDPYSILRSWLAQMLVQDPKVFRLIDTYSTTRMSKGQSPTHLDLWQIFGEIGRSIPECIFVMDGFDECDYVNSGVHYHTKDPRSDFLRDLIIYLSKTKCRLLAFSRDVPDIRAQLGKDSATSDNLLMSEYAITAKDTSLDVKAFSESMVNHKLSKKPQTLRTEIAKQAAERCEGMFLWIKLLENEISPGQSSKEILQTVSEMPTRISEAYTREVERIIQLPQRHRSKAQAILRWVRFAIRPMKVKELAEALVLSENDHLTDYPRDNLPDMWCDSFVDEDYVNEMILGRCGSLLELRSKALDDPLADCTVHFVHFSVKEYLNSLISTNPFAQVFGFRDGNTEQLHLSKICLHYLTLDVFRNVSPDTRVVPPGIHLLDSRSTRFPPDPKAFPFLTYASWAWYFHAYFGKPLPPDDVRTWTRKTFDPSTSCSRVWGPFLELRLIDMEDGDRGSSEYKGKSFRDMLNKRHYLQQFPRSVDCSIIESGFGRHDVAIYVANPLYYASLLGLKHVVKWLEEQELHLCCEGGRFGFPLQAAIVGKHEDVVSHILGRCDILQKGGVYGTAINAAAAVSTLETISILLEKGSDLTATSQSGLTALHQASRKNTSKVIEYLLRKGADINAINDWGSTAISVACENGNKDAALTLLGKGADLTIANKAGDLPVHIATMRRQGDVACQLINAGAPVDVARKDGSTLFLVAVACKCLPVVKRLLEMKTDVNRSFRRGQTALHHAAANDDPIFSQLLLAAGADVACCDHLGTTPLEIAVMNGHEGIATLLLAQGARISQTPRSIFVAVETGNLAMVQLLLDHGASVYGISSTQETLFDWALRLGRLDITELIVRQGCFRMPILMRKATARRRIENVGQVDVEFLMMVLSGDANRVKSLIQERPITVDQEDLDEALCIAAARGYAELVILLLANGANGNRKDSNGRTALHHAVRHGHSELAFLLIKKGGNACLEDDVGSTPIDIAINRGLMALPFIQRHLKEYFDVIKNRASHCKRARLSTENLNDHDVRKAICGQWEGYNEISGEKDPFAILIPDGASIGFSDPNTFYNTDNEDQGGKFQCYGLVDPTGIIWFIKLYPDHGWLHRAEFIEQSKTLRGVWGTNWKGWNGLFELSRPQHGSGSIVRKRSFHDQDGSSVSVTDDGHVITRKDGVMRITAPLSEWPQLEFFARLNQPQD